MQKRIFVTAVPCQNWLFGDVRELLKAQDKESLDCEVNPAFHCIESKTIHTFLRILTGLDDSLYFCLKKCLEEFKHFFSSSNSLVNVDLQVLFCVQKTFLGLVSVSTNRAVNTLV